MRKKFTPREYQNLMIDFAEDVNRCALWAGMGMGKTSSMLTSVDRRLVQGASYPTLVLAPLLVAKTTWPDEARKWHHLRNIRVVPVVGSEVQRRKALGIDASIYTTNYEQLPWLIEHFGERWPFRHVIADESTRLKSFRTKQGGKRARALGRIAHTKIKYFTELTGTPSPNGLLDLWGQMWMIDGGQRLGRTFTAYRDRWFRNDYDGTWKPFEHSEAEIHEALRDVCLTINPKDWFDLKEPIVRNFYVELPVVARARYKEMEKKLFTEIEGRGVNAANSAVKTQKLLQLANGAVYVDPLVETDEDPRSKEFKPVHDVKIQALESIIAEASGMPVLVAYHFKSDLKRLLDAFPRGVHLAQQGSSRIMKEWNEGKIPVLFAHPASAGHGLNLQDGGNILVYFGHDWNLEHRQQIFERVGPVRQLQAGHDRPTFIYNIVARDTVDELVMARVETKAAVQELLLAAMSRHRRST